MKLMVVVPIWKREATTKLVLDWYEKIDCDVLVVGSEGEKSRRMSQGPYLEAPNYPLDAKYDLGISHCRMYDPDAVALVGSDDFITGDYFEWAMSQIALGFDMVGLLDFYLTDLVTGADTQAQIKHLECTVLETPLVPGVFILKQFLIDLIGSHSVERVNMNTCQKMMNDQRN